MHFKISIFLLLLSSLPSMAATWIEAANGQWYYVDDYLPASFFVLETENSESRIFHAIPFPLEALESDKCIEVEIRETEKGFELWSRQANNAHKIIDLSPEGVLYFNKHPATCFYLAKKVSHILKEMEDGRFELWDIDSNERIIELSAWGVEEYRKNPSIPIMTLEEK